MSRINQLLSLFPPKMQYLFQEMKEDKFSFSEIRMRAGQPLLLTHREGDFYVDQEGKLTLAKEEGVRIDIGMLRCVLDYLCQHSLYAYQDQIANGFFTIVGGHRVGVAGTIITDGKGVIQGMKYISSINIRIAGEYQGISQAFLPYIYCRGILQNVLLVSPPGYGKTTMLRDLIYQISTGNSYGNSMTVSVVDERGEISGCSQGVPCLNLGEKTDVMYGCQKAEGMMMLLRSMAPQVIAVDELGGRKEREAILEIGNSGVNVLATVHGKNLEEIRNKQGIHGLLKEVFRVIVFLTKKEGNYGMGEIYRWEESRGGFELCKES